MPFQPYFLPLSISVIPLRLFLQLSTYYSEWCWGGWAASASPRSLLEMKNLRSTYWIKIYTLTRPPKGFMGTLQFKKGCNHTDYSFCLKCLLILRRGGPLLPTYVSSPPGSIPWILLDSMYSLCTPLVLCTCFCHPLVIDVWPASLVVMGRGSLICL